VTVACATSSTLQSKASVPPYSHMDPLAAARHSASQGYSTPPLTSTQVLCIKHRARQVPEKVAKKRRHEDITVMFPAIFCGRGELCGFMDGS
jgi:hypothetical protein